MSNQISHRHNLLEGKNSLTTSSITDRICQLRVQRGNTNISIRYGLGFKIAFTNKWNVIKYAHISYNIWSHFNNSSNADSRFKLRIQRSTNGQLQRLIKKALEKTLDQCQQLRLLPSNINSSYRKKWPIFSLYSRRRTGFEQIVETRCKKFINILPYAQQMLC